MPPLPSLARLVATTAACAGLLGGCGLLRTAAETPGRIANPAAVIRWRNVRVLAASRSRSAVLADSLSNAATAAPVIIGARVFENRYGRERWRSSATIGAGKFRPHRTLQPATRALVSVF